VPTRTATSSYRGSGISGLASSYQSEDAGDSCPSSFPTARAGPPATPDGTSRHGSRLRPHRDPPGLERVDEGVQPSPATLRNPLLGHPGSSERSAAPLPRASHRVVDSDAGESLSAVPSSKPRPPESLASRGGVALASMNRSSAAILYRCLYNALAYPVANS